MRLEEPVTRLFRYFGMAKTRKHSNSPGARLDTSLKAFLTARRREKLIVKGAETAPSSIH